MVDLKNIPPHFDNKTGEIVEKEYIYIAFYCEPGCQVLVTVLTAREADAIAKGPQNPADQAKKEKPDYTNLEKSLHGKNLSQ